MQLLVGFTGVAHPHPSCPQEPRIAKCQTSGYSPHLFLSWPWNTSLPESPRGWGQVRKVLGGGMSGWCP